MRTKGTAAVLALFLGGLGGHKFYLGQTFQGLLYLFFSWTFIPAILALFEFVIYLMMPVATFNQRYNAELLLLQQPQQQQDQQQNQQQNITVNIPGHHPGPAAAPKVDVISQLEKLGEMRVSGLLSEEEFESQKQKLLAEPSQLVETNTLT